MKQHLLTSWRLVAVISILALTVAGCGGSGNGGSTVMDNPMDPTPAPADDPLKMARADLAEAQAALTAAGMDVMAQQTAHEQIVAARMKIHDLVKSADTQALLDQAKMDLAAAMEAVKNYNSDAAKLDRAKMALTAAETTYEAAKNAVVVAQAAYNAIETKDFSNPAYVVAYKNLLEANTAQLVAFNEVVDLRETVDGLTPETEKLKAARDALAEQVKNLQARLAAEEAKNRRLAPDPVVSSPFKGGSVMQEIMKTANMKQASMKIKAAAGTAAIASTKTMDDMTLTGVRQVTGGVGVDAAARADAGVADLAVFAEKTRSGVDYTLMVGTDDDEATLSNGRLQFAVTDPENSAATPADIDDGRLIVNAATTYKEGNSDYMSYGFWIYVPDDKDATSLGANPYQFGVFTHGNNPSLTKDDATNSVAAAAALAALTGTATYNGTATGLYTNTGSNKTGVYDATAQLTADFGKLASNAAQGGNITGTLTNSRIDGVAIPGGGTIILQGASAWTGTANVAGNIPSATADAFTTPAEGILSGSAVMVKGTTQLTGSWGGLFYGDVGTEAAPKTPSGVGGTFGVTGGTEAIIGAFGATR